MIDTDDPAIAPRPSAKLRHASTRASAQLAPLVGLIEPLAARRPDAPVPADLLVLARRALKAIGPIAKALGAPPPLPLHPPVTYAGLAARLTLAARHSKTFRRRHFAPDSPLEAIIWHTEDRALAVAADRPRRADAQDEWAGHR